MITLKGAEVSAKIKEQTAEMLKQCGGRIPKLAIVRVGENPDDLSYERGAVKKMAAFGLSAESMPIPRTLVMRRLRRSFRRSTGIRRSMGFSCSVRCRSRSTRERLSA